MTATPRTTPTPRTTRLDLSGMYAAHDSFRRDLDRLLVAAGQGPQAFVAAGKGWANFKHQLGLHHRAEDQELWPRLRRSVTAPADLHLLDLMEAEHASIDPLVEAIDRSAAVEDAALDRLVSLLADQLVAHLAHEEDEALPLVDAALPARDWRAFTWSLARAEGIKGAASFLPWVLDGDQTDAQRHLAAALPAPARLIYRTVLLPRYRRRRLWGDPTG